MRLSKTGGQQVPLASRFQYRLSACVGSPGVMHHGELAFCLLTFLVVYEESCPFFVATWGKLGGTAIFYRVTNGDARPTGQVARLGTCVRDL